MRLMAQSDQLALFDAAPMAPRLPPGLRYEPGVLAAREEAKTIAAIAALDLRPFEFHGFLGARRTASFGWRYDFNGAGLTRADPIPSFLLSLRERAGAFAGTAADRLEHVLVTEYAPGAGIGWHRDRPQFGVVVALSLAGPCRLRFRRKTAVGWERAALTVAPRSAYLLTGPARGTWQHSIPPVEALRYSVTFRTLRTEKPSIRR